jgi:hypothetical protein
MQQVWGLGCCRNYKMATHSELGVYSLYSLSSLVTHPHLTHLLTLLTQITLCNPPLMYILAGFKFIKLGAHPIYIILVKISK